MAQYDQKPVLKNTETGQTLTLYFTDFRQGPEDYTVEHHPPGRDGDIEQDMGRGSNKYRGTIQITRRMHDQGIEGYKDELIDMARTGKPLEMTLDNGDTVMVTLKEPELDKGTGNAPNKMTVPNIELSEIDQPVNTLYGGD